MSSTSSIGSSVSALNTDLGSNSSTSGTSSDSSSLASSGAASTGYATTNTVGAVSSLGIGSGINATALISSLMAANQAPITAINSQIAGYQANLSAYGTLSASVYAFQTALGGLTSASDFESTSATSSDSSVLSATSSSTAPQGSYSITVNQLAAAQTLVAAGQSSASAAIGSGAATTISFQFGTIGGGTLANGTYSGSTFTQGTAGGGSVTINSSNNSLQGIAAAINAANVGVTASVVNDGSSSPYRLSLTSNTSGAAGSMKITVSGDSTLASLLGNDPAGTQNLTQTQAAQNASLDVNGLAISSASNTVSQTIAGTSLDLTGTGTTTLNVAQDTSTIVQNVQSFVTAYNALDSSISSLTAAGPSGTTAGALAGQYNVLQMQSQLREALNTPMVAANGKETTLASVGIEFNSDGQLTLNSGALESAISSNAGSVGALFAQNGVTSDSLINFVSAGSSAAPGTYNVNVSQIATQGSLTGSVAAGTTITAGQNDGLNVVVDGTAAQVTIPPGSYTAASLATAVQSAINGASALSSAGKSVSVAQNNGVLTISSSSYGSKSFVSLGGNGSAGLIGSSPTYSTGVNVAGTIDGLPATGSGQTLTGAVNSAVNGVNLTVTGGSTGSRGTVSISQGYSNVLNSLATNFNGSSGLITAATNELNSDITDDQAQVSRMNEQLTLLQQQYQTEFSNLDTILSGLNSTQSYLTGQLASIAATTNYIYSNPTT